MLSGDLPSAVAVIAAQFTLKYMSSDGSAEALWRLHWLFWLDQMQLSFIEFHVSEAVSTDCSGASSVQVGM